MRSIVIKDWGKPLEIVELPKPMHGPGEVLVRLKATGVCHTDVHQWRGDWLAMRLLMEKHGVKVLGHEGIGVVEDIGPGVSRLAKGDRVGVPWMNYWCGACELCLTGDPHYCFNAKYTSVHVNGTYAEYAIINERAAPRIPKEISDVEAAPLMCAGNTAYGAIRKLVTEARIPSGKPIAVIGAAGGLGHYAVQIARAFGYRVIGIDIGRDRIEFVERIGADYAIEAIEAEKFIKDKFGGVYASLIFAPKISGYELGIRILRSRGVLIAVGAPDEGEGSIPNLTPISILVSGIKIFPSIVGVTHEFEELFSLVAAGKVKSHISRIPPLSEVNTIFRDLLEAKYVGRAVLEIR